MLRKAGLPFLALVLLFALSIAPLSAQSGAVCQNLGKPLAQGADPAPQLGLFVPKAETRSCYGECVIEWNATMCAGYTGAMLQQCQADGAEGCRCHCYGC